MHILHRQRSRIDGEHLEGRLPDGSRDRADILVAHGVKDEDRRRRRFLAHERGQAVLASGDLLQRDVGDLTLRLRLDERYDIIRRHRHLRIAARVGVCQEHAVHEHGPVDHDAAGVRIRRHDDGAVVLPQSIQRAVDLRADIAAQRRIDALVAEIRAFPQARERIVDAAVSLLRRHAPRVRRIGQHIHFRRVLQREQAADRKPQLLHERPRSIRPREVISNNDSLHDSHPLMR